MVTFFPLRGGWRALPVVTAALVLGPLMGLHVNGPGRRGEVRVVSWQVQFGESDTAMIESALREADPDVVLLEAVDVRMFESLRGAFGDRVWIHEDQFAIGSRWPVRLVHLPELGAAGRRSWARFAVDAPLGTLDVFLVHPQSLRPLLRFGLRQGVRRALAGEGTEVVTLRAALREIDVAARHGGALRVVAGDFNVPGGSGLWRGLFEGTADAFAQAGNGYGYTFPTHKRWIPWMRIDRLLTGPGLLATRAQVIGRRGSNHAALLVEISRREPAPAR